jgi:hypothetical protein
MAWPRKHGLSQSGGVYQSWQSMRQRCENPNNHNYPRYGGRGIRVCERWMKFQNFLIDMGERPTPKHSIERKDNNGNYEPGNCVWATPAQQSRNRRISFLLTMNGETKTLAEWCEQFDAKYPSVWCRLKRGVDLQHALLVPKRKRAA